jgi:hypothetical protein
MITYKGAQYVDWAAVRQDVRRPEAVLAGATAMIVATAKAPKQSFASDHECKLQRCEICGGYFTGKAGVCPVCR